MRSINYTLTVDPFNYTISASPSSATIDPDGSATSTINTTRISEIPQSVSFSITGLPSGVTVSFTPNNCDPTCSSTLTLNTLNSALPGTYELTIIATGIGGSVQTTVYTLTIRPFDYSVTSVPNTGSVEPGESISSDIIISYLTGYSEIVDFSVTGLPSGATANFSPTFCTPSCTSALTINTTGGTSYGNYTLTITGIASGGLERTTNYQLLIATYPGNISDLNAVGGDELINLTWSAPSDGGATINDYRIYRGLTSGSEIYYDNVGSASTNYTDSGLSIPNQRYYYKVSAVNSIGEGGLSNEANAIPKTVPAKTTGLSATPGSGNVSLSWSAPYNGGYSLTQYRIYRGTSSGGETHLTYVSAPTTNYTDNSVTPGNTYYYQVSALNTLGEGERSDEASATVPVSCSGYLHIDRNGVMRCWYQTTTWNSTCNDFCATRGGCTSPRGDDTVDCAVCKHFYPGATNCDTQDPTGYSSLNHPGGSSSSCWSMTAWGQTPSCSNNYCPWCATIFCTCNE